MARIKDYQEYLSQYEQAKIGREDYWDSIAQEYTWSKKWNKVLSGNFKDLNIKWFEGGKCNISENCLDRHLSKRGDKTALIYEPNDPNGETLKYTYKQLHQKVCQFANVLEKIGVQKGDRVCFYMAMVPELMIGILATARIGAIHCVVFGGFSAKALAGRVQDCEAKVLITNDGCLRGEKMIPLKDISDEALKRCSTVEKVIVHQRANNKVSWLKGRDHWWHELTEEVSVQHPARPMDSEDPLFILYTSGSTGQPKGLLHTTAGYMVYAGHTFENVFQVNDDDIYWCSADIGWITGHTYMTYGPLLKGATTMMFEGVPTYPDAGRFWKICDKHQVTHFYTAPTAIRALEACGLDFVTPYNLSSLKVLGTVGEPINEEAWSWYNKNIGKGKCPIVDTWWQTETGGILISPLAGITETIPSYATQPLPGIEPVLLDAEGKEVTKPNTKGSLCMKHPWPGIARTIWGNHQRYADTYFSAFDGHYFTGDGALKDEKGNFRITGRVDDVIVVSGHNIGTAEVEDAINQHTQVVESAVVGYPHEIKGQGIYAYLICQDKIDNPKTLHNEINQYVNQHLGGLARPEKIQVVSGLPKTRSGKIMRRILRKIAAGKADQLGDVSTLLNPEVVDEIVKG